MIPHASVRGQTAAGTLASSTPTSQRQPPPSRQKRPSTTGSPGGSDSELEIEDNNLARARPGTATSQITQPRGFSACLPSDYPAKRRRTSSDSTNSDKRSQKSLMALRPSLPVQQQQPGTGTEPQSPESSMFEVESHSQQLPTPTSDRQRSPHIANSAQQAPSPSSSLYSPSISNGLLELANNGSCASRQDTSETESASPVQPRCKSSAERGRGNSEMHSTVGKFSTPPSAQPPRTSSSPPRSPLGF
jgi:hypothetical protein